MKAIFFFSEVVINTFSGPGPVSSSESSPLLALQDAARSRSCCLPSLGLVLRLSSSRGAVGFWNATERKRTDSILASGANERMCRLSCFVNG